MIRIPPQRGGWLEVICGPMFSGKSEEMIRRLRRAEIAGQQAVIFKPAIDDRYDAADVVSHAGIRMRAVPVASVPELRLPLVGVRRRGDRRGAVLRASRSSRLPSTSPSGEHGSSPLGSTRTSDGSRSAPSRSSSPTPSSWTSSRPCATAAAVRRRRRSDSWTGALLRTPARRSSSAPPSSTRRAAAAATRPAWMPPPSSPRSGVTCQRTPGRARRSRTPRRRPGRSCRRAERPRSTRRSARRAPSRVRSPSRARTSSACSRPNVSRR